MNKLTNGNHDAHNDILPLYHCVHVTVWLFVKPNHKDFGQQSKLD